VSQHGIAHWFAPFKAVTKHQTTDPDRAAGAGEQPTRCPAAEEASGGLGLNGRRWYDARPGPAPNAEKARPARPWGTCWRQPPPRPRRRSERPPHPRHCL